MIRSQQYAQALARNRADAMAHRRPDYTVREAGDLLNGDGVRFVPTPNQPIPADLVQPLIATNVSTEFGLTAVTVIPRERLTEWVVAALRGYEGEDTRELVMTGLDTIVMDATYPVLVR
jgi:hypothetical protein